VRVTPTVDETGWFDVACLRGTVTFRAPSRRTLVVPIVGAGPYEPRWGTVAVRVEIVDAAGEPAAGARLVVDGELHVADAAGRFALDGLDAGPHAVLVMPAGPGAGVLWRFEAAAGATRERRLVLP
jgi:hypothetical protein